MAAAADAASPEAGRGPMGGARVVSDAVSSGSLCGVWVADDGEVWTARATPTGDRAVARERLRPFAWLTAPPAEVGPGVSVERLSGEGVFSWLVHAETQAAYEDFLARRKTTGLGPVDAIRPLESQYLLQTRQRLYAGMAFRELRRCQLDIETASAPGTFSDPARPEDRVLAIGLRLGEREATLILEDLTDDAEKALLERFNGFLAAEDPDVIEGHNLFKFDLAYLRQRCRRLRVPCNWGRFGQRAVFRSSRLKVAERWIDFPRVDLPGRTVVDTYLLVQLHDITTRELTSYGLKEVAVYFGVTPEGENGRTHLPGDRIFEAFRTDRARFRAYLADDLRETGGLADVLLPTYFEQTRTFPILFQEATLRGTTGKIDLLFLEEYYHARQACPTPPEVAPFEGGYTRSFREGVFRHVLHFDVASLYPSLLLHIGRAPRGDTLGVFIPLLKSLREYRLQCKLQARTAETEELRAEYQARQTNFKILINSFYGYLGFAGARFGDGELAAEVTRLGRELLQRLIAACEEHGCTILEADTDGIYLSSETYYAVPEALLERLAPVLPPGIELEYDGRYEAMFCYKAKNYALYDGRRIILRGSALRSRGIEPYLKELTDQLVRYVLGVSADSPLDLLARYQEQLTAQTFPVEQLAKSEVLSMNPEAYERFVEGGGKPRRASAEAALQLQPRPRMGDRVSYYITARSKGRPNDWQRARPLELYEPATPYDAAHYLRKLDDWRERYGVFLGLPPPAADLQTELPW